MTDSDHDVHGPEHGHDHPHGHEHSGGHDHGPVAAEGRPPTEPSRAVMVDVGPHTGALVLTAAADREGVEVEIHPASDPTARTHVWVLPREGRTGTVYAAVFPSLRCGDYVVLALDGAVASRVTVAANEVTSSTWS